MTRRKKEGSGHSYFSEKGGEQRGGGSVRRRRGAGWEGVLDGKITPPF